MRPYSLQCPDCGAPLNIETDNSFVFCSHCGNKIYLNDGVQRIKIDITNTQKDETAIKKAEFAYKTESLRVFTFAAILLIWIAIVAFVFIFGTMSNQDRIYMRTPASKYRGENYKTVEREFKEMGFENIELVSSTDGGFFTSQGEVLRISIKGNSDFPEGSTFAKEDPVTITYYEKAKSS